MARRAAKRSPIPILETKGKPRSDFVVVIVASSVARGRVRTTAATTEESCKMAALLHILGSLRYEEGKGRTGTEVDAEKFRGSCCVVKNKTLEMSIFAKDGQCFELCKSHTILGNSDILETIKIV